MGFQHLATLKGSIICIVIILYIGIFTLSLGCGVAKGLCMRYNNTRGGLALSQGKAVRGRGGYSLLAGKTLQVAQPE